MKDNVTEGFWDRFDELLQGATTAALAATARPVPRAAALDLLSDLKYVAGQILMDRRPAMVTTVLGVERDARDAATLVRVLLTCQHVGHFRLSEEGLWSRNTRELIEYVVDTLVSVPERKCSCMHSERS